jgi:hypothetical protein
MGWHRFRSHRVRGSAGRAGLDLRFLDRTLANSGPVYGRGMVCVASRVCVRFRYPACLPAPSLSAQEPVAPRPPRRSALHKGFPKSPAVTSDCQWIIAPTVQDRGMPPLEERRSGPAANVPSRPDGLGDGEAFGSDYYYGTGPSPVAEDGHEGSLPSFKSIVSDS